MLDDNSCFIYNPACLDYNAMIYLRNTTRRENESHVLLTHIMASEHSFLVGTYSWHLWPSHPIQPDAFLHC